MSPSTVCGIPLESFASRPKTDEVAQIVADWNSEMQANFFDALARFAAEQWNEVRAARLGGMYHATTDQQCYWIANDLTPRGADLLRAIVAHYDYQEAAHA